MLDSIINLDFIGFDISAMPQKYKYNERLTRFCIYVGLSGSIE